GPGLCYDRDASGGLVDDRLDHQPALIARHGREFAGRPAGYDAVDAGVDAAVDQLPDAVGIDVPVDIERGRQRGQHTAQVGTLSRRRLIRRIRRSHACTFRSCVLFPVGASAETTECREIGATAPLASAACTRSAESTL